MAVSFFSVVPFPVHIALHTTRPSFFLFLSYFHRTPKATYIERSLTHDTYKIKDGFFDSGMLPQPLKARGHHRDAGAGAGSAGGDLGAKAGSERASARAARRKDIGKKLRLVEY